MATERLIRQTLDVRGREEVTVASPLILPDNVTRFMFRVKRPTLTDAHGQFSDENTATRFQVWESTDGREWVKGWAFEDTGGRRVINDRPWEPRIYRRGEIVNDATTRYRAREDTDQPYTNPRYWQDVGSWVPKEHDHTWVRFKVGADGKQFLVTALHDGEVATKLEPELVYVTGERIVSKRHNSVAIEDDDIVGDTAGSVVTSGTVVTAGSDRLVAAVVLIYGGSPTITTTRWGAAGGDPSLDLIGSSAGSYSRASVYKYTAPTDDRQMQVAVSGANQIWLRVISVSNADQSTQPLASGTWLTSNTWSGGSQTISNNIPAAAGAMVFGGAIFVDLDYSGLSNPSVGSGQNSFSSADSTGALSSIASYETAGGATESTSFTMNGGTSGYTVYYSIAAFTIKEVEAGGGEVNISVDNLAVTGAFSQPAITQTHEIDPDNLALADAFSEPTLQVGLTIDADDMALADEFSEPTLTQTHVIDTDDLSVADAFNEPAITQTHALDPDDLALADTFSQPSVSAGGDPPAGDIDFDCAVGHDALALRNIAYDDTDFDSDGFKLQYAYAINGGSFSDWIDVELGSQSGFNYDWYLEAKWPYEFDDDGDDFTSGDYVSVKMRTVNSYGAGSESATKIYRVHSSWHRTGVRRYNPSTAVGHAAAGYDVTTDDHHEGPITTGGTNRMVLLAYDIAYGDNVSGNIIPHTAHYNGDVMTKLLSYENNSREEPGPGQSGGGNGGCEIHYLVNPDSGQHTMELDWDDPTSQKSLWLAAAAFQNVDQTLPIDGWRIRLSPGPPTFDGVTNIPLDPVLDALNPTERRDFHLPRAVASMDELILGFQGAYGSGLSGDVNSNTFGEAGVTGASWGSHTASAASLTDGIPYDTNLVIFAGCGMGNEDESRLAAYLPGTLPTEMPVFTLHWERAEVSYLTLIQFGIRPTPDMIHTLQVNAATTGAIDFQFGIYCNHGDILLAVTSQTDPEPTSVQIQDELDSLGSSDYEDTIHILDTHTMTNGEVSASAGGTVTDSLAGLPAGNYRLTAVYQPQQGFKGGTGSLGPAITAEFSIEATDIDPDDMGVAQALSQPTIAQTHVVAPNDLAVADALSEPEIGQTHEVTPAALTVSDSLSEPAITQTHSIDPEDAALAPVFEEAGITQGTAIVVDDASAATSLSEPAITQEHQITANNLAVAVTLGVPSVSDESGGHSLIAGKFVVLPTVGSRKMRVLH